MSNCYHQQQDTSDFSYIAQGFAYNLGTFIREKDP